MPKTTLHAAATDVPAYPAKIAVSFAAALARDPALAELAQEIIIANRDDTRTKPLIECLDRMAENATAFRSAVAQHPGVERAAPIMTERRG